MLEKRFLVILPIVNILLIGGFAFFYLKTDREGPVITAAEQFVYSDDVTDSEILSRLQAVDQEDGDVSRTLVIEKIVPDERTKTAWITCGARDEKGNISKYTWNVPCDETVFAKEGERFSFAVGEAESMLPPETENEQNPAEDGADEENEQNPAQDGADEENEAAADGEEAAESEGEETAGESGQETADQGNEANAEANDEAENREAEIDEIEDREAGREEEQGTENGISGNGENASSAEASAAPSLVFSSSEIKTKKGYNPAWVTVIAQLSDNTDSYDTLLHNLKIQGAFDNATAGSYDVLVSAVDSEGNESPAVPIRIIVEE